MRSAAFSLGVLQALERERIVSKADYISAVSGGAYIAAGAATVAALNPEGPDADIPPFGEGSPELHHLRTHSKYLANGPRLRSRIVLAMFYGIASALVLIAAWTFVFARPTGWMYSEVVAPRLERCDELRAILPFPREADSRRFSCGQLEARYHLLAVKRDKLRELIADKEGELAEARKADAPAIRADLERLRARLTTAHVHALHLEDGLLRLLPGLVLLAIAITLTVLERSVLRYRITATAFLRAWASRMLVMSLLAVAVIFALPEVLAWLRNVARWPARGEGQDPLFGWLNNLLNVIGLGPPKEADGAEGVGLSVGVGAALATSIVAAAARTVWRARPARSALLRIAAYLLVPALILGILLKFVNDAAAIGWSATSFIVWLSVAGLGCGIALPLIYRVNRSSLHDLYRERLASAFLVHRLPDGARAEPVRYDEPLLVSKVHSAGRPELVVCAAANITDPGTTPLGINSLPFTFDAVMTGIPADIWMPDADASTRCLYSTESWEQVALPDVTLPAAVAMSGAAFSPLMGRQSKPAFRVLLALLNLRLGQWLPNPARCTELQWPRGDSLSAKAGRAWREPGAKYLLYEALGHSSLRDRYVYVTDGGHYDNLGLVELLRRGCTKIYCADASGAPPGSFATLAESVALAASDLDVDVDVDSFTKTFEFDRDTKEQKQLVGVGEFRYASSTRVGTIHYMTLGITPDVPLEVRSYFDVARARVGSKENTRLPNHFPWDPTSDQLFDHRKLEAYRALGKYAGDVATRRAKR